MKEIQYGITKNIGHIDFDAAVDKVAAALKTEGFGVLTEIDVQATLKKKLNVDRKKYKILGACNPPLAHKSISAEPLIGLLLPCNVVVMEEEDNSIVVSAINPEAIFKVVENDVVTGPAAEVTAKLNRVIDSFGPQ